MSVSYTSHLIFYSWMIFPSQSLVTFRYANTAPEVTSTETFNTLYFFFSDSFKLYFCHFKNWSTVHLQYIMYTEVIQIHTHTLFLIFFSIMVYHRIFNTVLCSTLYFKSLFVSPSRLWMSSGRTVFYLGSSTSQVIYVY